MKPLPDPYPIEPLAKPPKCTITVPGSKSITNRALILAALSDGKCTLRGALWADDTQVMVDSLQKLGFEVKVEPDTAEECNRTITVVGRGGEIPAKKAELYVGNAGTAARFLTALVCLGHGEYTIRGDKRMHERPMKALFDALRNLGARIDTPNHQLPATIHAKGLQSGILTVSTRESSQFVSALALISRPAKIVLKRPNDQRNTLQQDPESEAYITMTYDMLHIFDIRGLTHPEYIIEPDLSSASYFKAAEFLFRNQGAKVEVARWPEDILPRLQIDRGFPSFLPPPQRVSRATGLGDSIMTLAICALFGNNVLQVTNAERMRLQETNRLEKMVTELKRVGAEAEETDDGFIVHPAKQGQLHGADIETYNDHRMAMCFAVLGLKIPGIRIKNPGCVSKTFPNFFEKLEQLRQ